MNQASTFGPGQMKSGRKKNGSPFFAFVSPQNQRVYPAAKTKGPESGLRPRKIGLVAGVGFEPSIDLRPRPDEIGPQEK